MADEKAGAARLESLDVFRGATIASMILVNNLGSYKDAYAQLLHADWHGWTFTDVIFPSFLWIVGVALTLSFARRIERGDGRRLLLLHTLRRAAIIFGLGLLLNGFPHYDPATIRIPGVLQRIAVCYLIAAAIFLYTQVRGQVAAIVILHAGYWMLMMLYPTPGCGAGSLSKECNFARYIDGLLFSGHMWSHTKTWDPEGVVSTLPAITTTLFGILTGHLLRWKRTEARRTAWMFIGAGTLVLAGTVLSAWMPINKNLWTTPYTLLMAGLSLGAFALCYWLIDIQGRRKWTRPFAVYGMNAITIYVLSGVLGDALTLLKPGGVSLQAMVHNGLLAVLAPKAASAAYGLLHVLLLYGVAHVMYRRKWFVRV